MKYSDTNLVFEIEKPGEYISLRQYSEMLFRYYFPSQFLSGRNALEIGCGYGLGYRFLSEKARTFVVGDLTVEGLLEARRYYGPMNAVRMDAHLLPFKESYFHTILAMGVVVYVRMGEFLDECRRVLKKKGCLIFNIANTKSNKFKPAHFTRNYFPADELDAMLKGHGFSNKIYGLKYLEDTKLSRSPVFFSNFLKIFLSVLYVLPFGRKVKEVLVRMSGHSIRLGHELKQADIQSAEKGVSLKRLKSLKNISDMDVIYFVSTKK